MVKVIRTRKEIWKDIPNYEGYYKISNCGRIKSLTREAWNGWNFHNLPEIIKKPQIDKDGYYVVCLYKEGFQKTCAIHLLEAMAFYKHTPCGFKLVINHKNNIKRHNYLDNLEITTQRINTNKKHLKHSSKYTGVSWHKASKKWMARIWVNDKQKHLGYFTDEVKASLCYQGELRKINQQNENYASTKSASKNNRRLQIAA